jgi:hypothetical protein
MDLFTPIKILLVAVAATSAMTLFSYAISHSFRELYKEPVLLKHILIKTKLELTYQTKEILAWLIHYLIGLAFILGYYFLWNKTSAQPSITTGLVLGAISGIIGILGWVILFKISNYKPKIDFKNYYIQLFFAHIIFAFVATSIFYVFIY